MNKKTLLKTAGIIAVLGLVFGLGRMLAPGGDHAGAHGDHDAHADHGSAGKAAAETVWTCSMHPQVRQPDPGKCPICAMNLIPLTGDDDADEVELPRLRLSERALALMAVQTAPAQRAEAYAELRLPGRIAVDETRKAEVAAWFAGRIDRLYVDFAGTRVRVGEHLAEMYSPQLFGAQEEFLQAMRSVERQGEGTSDALVDAARTKLRLLGLSERQIDALREKGEASTHLTYYSPVSGTVLERRVSTGQYVETGTPMYDIADLSQVWVNLEAYESELQWLRFGQEVMIETAAYPEERFQGRIAYIQPEIDGQRRTARVRVNLPNEERKLKPGMLVMGTVKARIGSRGEVYDAFLAGKWISPMHPEIIKEGPGTCDVCGMDLVPAEAMGYFALSVEELEDPLLIPATAPLHTGKRSVVYVRLPEEERPVFEARTVVLGHRLGDAYPVISGLDEGDLVVTHGQFKIDSELQIRGRPSMMAPQAETAANQEEAGSPRDPPKPTVLEASVDEAFSKELIPLVEAYLALVEGLAADDVAAAGEGLKALHNDLLAIGQHRLTGDAHVAWMDSYRKLHQITHAMTETPSIAHYRDHLQALTHIMESIYVTFGGGHLPPVNRAYCPMVDGDQIGTWLQRGDRVTNPYWGDTMFRCGDIIGPLTANPGLGSEE